MRSKLVSLVMLCIVIESMIAGKLELSLSYYAFLIGLSYSEIVMVTVFDKFLELTEEGGDCSE